MIKKLLAQSILSMKNRGRVWVKPRGFVSETPWDCEWNPVPCDSNPVPYVWVKPRGFVSETPHYLSLRFRCFVWLLLGCLLTWIRSFSMVHDWIASTRTSSSRDALRSRLKSGRRATVVPHSLRIVSTLYA